MALGCTGVEGSVVWPLSPFSILGQYHTIFIISLGITGPCPLPVPCVIDTIQYVEGKEDRVEGWSHN